MTCRYGKWLQWCGERCVNSSHDDFINQHDERSTYTWIVVNIWNSIYIPRACGGTGGVGGGNGIRVVLICVQIHAWQFCPSSLVHTEFAWFSSHVKSENIDCFNITKNPLKMWYFPGFVKNQIQRLAQISVQQTFVYTIQFSPSKTVRFDFRGLNQRQNFFRRLFLEARCKKPCNYHSARPDLLKTIHRWSQGTKNHALTNMCSFRRGGITWNYQVRISYSRKN